MKVEFCPPDPDRWSMKPGIYNIVDKFTHMKGITVEGVSAHKGFYYPLKMFKLILTEEDYEDDI